MMNKSSLLHYPREHINYRDGILNLEGQRYYLTKPRPTPVWKQPDDGT